MKKIIFAIFAHPDDEAFGPSGTLLMETRAGTELHLISLTDGAGGTNPDNHANLGEVRLAEWRAGGKLMGACSMSHLGLRDGKLNNTAFLRAVHEIEEIVRQIVQSYTIPVEVEFMTNDLNGISGHIDHIVAARAACFVFYTLKRAGLPLTRIRLACLPQQYMPEVNIDWLYMEPGHPLEEINEAIDARPLHEEIIAIMRAHHTQRSDGETHIAQRGDQLGMNYFIVKT